MISGGGRLRLEVVVKGPLRENTTVTHSGILDKTVMEHPCASPTRRIRDDEVKVEEARSKRPQGTPVDRLRDLPLIYILPQATFLYTLQIYNSTQITGKYRNACQFK